MPNRSTDTQQNCSPGVLAWEEMLRKNEGRRTAHENLQQTKVTRTQRAEVTSEQFVGNFWPVDVYLENKKKQPKQSLIRWLTHCGVELSGVWMDPRHGILLYDIGTKTCLQLHTLHRRHSLAICKHCGSRSGCRMSCLLYTSDAADE